MKNTLQSAKKYIESQNVYESAGMRTIETDDLASLLVAYASACSAPSSIGDDVIRNKYPTTIAELGRKPDDTDEDGLFWYNHLRREGAKWAISRLSERKIVLPSDEDAKSYSMRIYPTNQSQYHEMVSGPLRARLVDCWNACIESIKRLNGIN